MYDYILIIRTFTCQMSWRPLDVFFQESLHSNITTICGRKVTKVRNAGRKSDFLHILPTRGRKAFLWFCHILLVKAEQEFLYDLLGKGTFTLSKRKSERVVRRLNHLKKGIVLFVILHLHVL